MAATGVAAVAEVAVAGMPAPTDFVAWLAMAHDWRWQHFLAVGAAMAATGVAATCGVAVAGMPAPTDFTA